MSGRATASVAPVAGLSPDDPGRIVYLIDDETPRRAVIGRLLALSDFRVLVFRSAAAYVDAVEPAVPGCLVLGADATDIGCLDLDRTRSGIPAQPIVFVTGQFVSYVQRRRNGAFDLLVKPLSDRAVLEAVQVAIARDCTARQEAAELVRLRKRYGLLTPREREVLPLIVSGLLNKQAAAELGISVVTLQIHRGNLMRKMAARSLADLVRKAAKLGIPVEERPPGHHV